MKRGPVFTVVDAQAELEYQVSKANIVNECSEELGSIMELPVLNVFNATLAPLVALLFPHVWTWVYDKGDERLKDKPKHAVPNIIMSNDYEVRLYS